MGVGHIITGELLRGSLAVISSALGSAIAK